ncbi:hypothetical protein [Actinokineospora bangkokensis]|uniref:Uncharacterized protein n=1 Tax=Actinokineospora bangkokensis TaxID=1193682 RepID=A0A1Q9LJ29_9PSEU|nr:hypothetical protein [Actinokineospora bangkokensis]OLR92004.1 hypothetical protein BJP25_24655 [Actinokineospora bangkokensis]
MSEQHAHPHVYTSTAVIDGEPITWVHHDHDGDWQVLGETPLETDDDAVLTHLEDLLALDPSVEQLLEIPQGHSAERDDKDSPWQVYEEPDDEQVCWTTRQVLDGEPVLVVFHTDDDEFEFLGATEPTEDNSVATDLETLAAADPSLPDPATVPPMHAAHRDSPDQPWQISLYEAADQDDEDAEDAGSAEGTADGPTAH